MKLSKLASLPLSEPEEKKLSEQLSKILDYIKKLNKIDTENIEPTYNVSGLENIMAPDEVSPSLPSKKGFFVTKGVFAGE